MPIFKQLNGKDRYHDSNTRQDVINYILQPNKILNRYIGWINIDMRNPAESMNLVSKHYNKTSGVQLRHFILAFRPDETDDTELVNVIAQQVMYWLGQRYQVIYAVHEDTEHLHVHFIFNPVSVVDGQRYYGTKKEYYQKIRFIKSVLHQYGFYRFEEISYKSGLNIQYPYE